MFGLLAGTNGTDNFVFLESRRIFNWEDNRRNAGPEMFGLCEFGS